MDPCIDQSSSTSKVINWELCILCQEDKQEQMQVPLTYTYTAQNLKQFYDNNVMPSDFQVDVAQLVEGSGIEDTLRSNKTMWHKSCRNKLSTKM